MTYTPDRIWARQTSTHGAIEIGSWADTVRHDGGTEYTRADINNAIFAGQAAEIEILRVALRTIKTASNCASSRDIARAALQVQPLPNLQVKP